MIQHKFNEGDLVRYAWKWCNEGERRYIHIVREVLLPHDASDTRPVRYLIETLNSGMFFNPTETVDEEMVELIAEGAAICTQ